MSDITITIPIIEPEALSNVEASTSIAVETERQALQMLREKYAPMARHAGYIKLAEYEPTANRRKDFSAYYENHYGKRIKGLRAFDGFTSEREQRHRGRLSGKQLYITEHGDWIELVRKGSWASWNGKPDSFPAVRRQWTCGVWWHDPDDMGGEDRLGTAAGSHELIGDLTVAENYNLPDILAELADSLKGLSMRIPQRMVKLRQRTGLAEQVLKSLAEVKC